MSITLPIPNSPTGNAHATTPSVYYPSTNHGEYQFISLQEIINNFIATYIGEGKILANSLKGDVSFHAHRALQELSYDTLKSCKSQEIEVCPSLKMPLPHDYVNYVKLTWSDSNGIEHVLYPAAKTSNPFAINQTENCEYEYSGKGLKEQKDCVTTEITCEEISAGTTWSSFINAYHPDNYTGSWPVSKTVGSIDYTWASYEELTADRFSLVDSYCQCLSNYDSTVAYDGNCGEYVHIDDVGYHPGDPAFDPGNVTVNAEGYYWLSPNGNASYNLSFHPTITYSYVACSDGSDTLNNYNSSSLSTNLNLSNTAATDDDIYTNNYGERYGIDPQHAQGNGSFYIDCLRGNIHFSSNMSGQTIILKYISDGHGTDDEMIVHKFAEEAMYKWIAYGCTSARIDVPENVIQRFKKEKFAETRKAKIRLSNIKIEEISQVFRGKSKWIKH